MTQPSIRSDFHKSFDIQGHGLAQIAFHHSISLYYIPDAHRFIFSQIFHLGIEIDSSLPTNLGRPALANAIDVGQTDQNLFAQRQIHSCDSSQFTNLLCFKLTIDYLRLTIEGFSNRPPLSRSRIFSSLALLMLRVGAPNLDHSFAAHYLALGAHLFD